MTQRKTYYRRHLPHYQPEHAEFHVVFRLTGSLPRAVIDRLRSERQAEEKRIAAISNPPRRTREWQEHQLAYFHKCDALLDTSSTGPRWLRDERVARIVVQAIHAWDGREYDLYAFTVIPNHVHMVVSTVCRDSSRPDKQNSLVKLKLDAQPEATREPSSWYPLSRILRRIKGLTGVECNRVLNRTGSFWQHESYDHVIRNGGELERTIWYVLYNPMKAGLVTSWEQWPWTYVKAALVGRA